MTSPTVERATQQQAPAIGVPPAIRIFEEADAAAVAEIFNDSEEGWPGGFRHGVPMTAELVLRRQREQQPQVTFIAWEGERAAGYCSFFEHPGERDTAGFIGLLNVATSFQGRGYGRDLLKAALAHALARGYRRIDLGTWPGNMKAVPLYKKTGFFWVPETYVHMENYLPLLLGLPALADFWSEADWYADMVRDLSVQEDLILQGKMRVYPYEFRHGERFVKATIDAAARGLTTLETERWRVSCVVDDRILIAGRPRTVRWDVENRTGRPLPLTLLAGAGKGMHLHKEETVVVGDRYTTEALLDADPHYEPPLFGERAPRVESLLLLDGRPLRLETGVEVHRPFSVALDPPRVALLPGQRRELTLQLRSYLDEPAAAHLSLVPSPGLTVEHAREDVAQPREETARTPQTLVIPLQAESYGGAMVQVTAETSGVHTLEVRGTVQVGETTVPLAPISLSLPAVTPGELVALTGEKPDATEHLEREVRVESATLRLIVDLREGMWHIQDAFSGDDLAGGLVIAGPPFRWTSQALVRHTPSVEQRHGASAVTLRGVVPHLPDAAIEHEFTLSQDGLLRIQTCIANAGATAAEMQAAVWLWRDHGRLPRTIVPTTYGVIDSDDPEWPDWSEPALQDPALYAEGWLAQQQDARVTGLIWSDAARIEASAWYSGVLQDTHGLQPGERRAFSPIYIYAGAGSWQTVRARWRQLCCPESEPRDPSTRPAVQLSGPLLPAALLPGANNLALSSVTNRELSGMLSFEKPPGWRITPETQQVEGVRAARSRNIQIAVQHEQDGPGATAIRARLRTERADMVVLDGALIDLGNGEDVRIDETSLAGMRVLQVDNGYLRYRVVPAYIGSVVALELVADGLNQLYSSFPEPREFGWMRPWYGGLYAAVYGDGWDGFPGHARLFEESLETEAVEEAGHDGRRWRGIMVRGMLKGKGLRGMELRAGYLTAPGSNLLAVRLAVRNHSGATRRVYPALAAYLQPDGTIEDAALLTDRAGQDRRLLRAQRTITVPADRWVAARNPATGRTLALIGYSHHAELRVVGEDWGTLGAHAGVQAAIRLRPGEERSALALLAVARDEAEARAYRVLAEAQDTCEAELP